MRLLWLLMLLAFSGIWSQGAHAAVGCSLNNPDEDIQRFFPEMTSYRVHFVTLKTQNPSGLPELERRLETPLDPIFETEDVPYSLYVVEGEQGRLGYVLGANNRGAHSSIQVIAALNAQGELMEVYLQRIRSPEAQRFRSKAFLEALAEQSLKAFSQQTACFRDGACEAALVADPSEGRAKEDYRAILRGLAKLYWLQDLLLFPLGGPAPRSLATQAEWIGNHRGLGLLDAVAHQPSLALTTPDDHAPETKVFVWGLGAYGLVWPLETLESHAALTIRIGDHTLLLARSHREGSPQLLHMSSPEALRPTRDVLWGDRIFVDNSSFSRWSIALGKAVYGEATGQPLRKLHGGFLLSWSEAVESGLILLSAAPESSSPRRLPLANGEYLVITHETEPPTAWSLAELSRDAIYRHHDMVFTRVGDEVAVWSRVDHQGREHHLTRESALFLRDRATGSRWSLLSGKALSGSLQGAQLTAPSSQILSEEGLLGLFPGAVREPQ